MQQQEKLEALAQAQQGLTASFALAAEQIKAIEVLNLQGEQRTAVLNDVRDQLVNLSTTLDAMPELLARYIVIYNGLMLDLNIATGVLSTPPNTPTPSRPQSTMPNEPQPEPSQPESIDQEASQPQGQDPIDAFRETFNDIMQRPAKTEEQLQDKRIALIGFQNELAIYKEYMLPNEQERYDALSSDVNGVVSATQDTLATLAANPSKASANPQDAKPDRSQSMRERAATKLNESAQSLLAGAKRLSGQLNRLSEGRLEKLKSPLGELGSKIKASLQTAGEHLSVFTENLKNSVEAIKEHLSNQSAQPDNEQTARQSTGKPGIPKIFTSLQESYETLKEYRQDKKASTKGGSTPKDASDEADAPEKDSGGSHTL